MKKSMRLSLAISLFASVSLVGCANSPLRIAMMSPDELHAVDEHRLCYAYHSHASNRGIIDEIKRRQLVAEADWESIKNGQIRVGMKRCAVVAIFGIPFPATNSSIDGQKQGEVILVTKRSGSIYRPVKSSLAIYLVDGVVAKVNAK